MTLLAAETLVDVARSGRRLAAPFDNLEESLAALREQLSANERPYADVVAARLAFMTDPARGAELANGAIASANLDPNDDVARKARSYAHLTLAMEAARAGRDDDVLLELARSAGAEDAASSPCTLGVAIDIERAIAVTRDAHGVAAATVTTRTSPELSADLIVPETARARLAACSSVGVVALPPLHGRPAILPSDVAWRYVSGAPRVTTATRDPRRVVVSDVRPPPSLDLPRLADWTVDAPGAVAIRGIDATPRRVLAEMAEASEVEIHAHGFVDAEQSSAAILALSTDADGRYSISSADLQAGSLHEHPIVVLGACHTATTTPYVRAAWSLPTAFVHAGASVVLASSSEIRDAEAGPFFDAVLTRIRAGAAPSVALRDERVAWLARDSKSWVRDVIDFE